MARIQAIVLFELLAVIVAAPSVQALPVQAPDGNSRALVSILDTGPMPGVAARAPSHPPVEGTLSWTGGPEADRAFWRFLLRGPGGWHEVDGEQAGNVAYSAPEPGTLLLVGAALAGAGVSIWRRRGRAATGAES